MKKRTVTTVEIVERVVVSAAHTETPRPPCPVCAGTAGTLRAASDRRRKTLGGR